MLPASPIRIDANQTSCDKLHMKNLIRSAWMTLLCLLVAAVVSSCADCPKIGELYFIGDSIIARWDLDECFPCYTTHNIGVGGSGVDYIESLAGTQTGHTVVVLSGTNNLDVMTDNLPKIDAYAQRFVDAVVALDASRVFVISILPRELTQDEKLLPTICRLNEDLALLTADHPDITIVDAYDDFMRGATIDYELFTDRLHLSDAGYERLSLILQRELDKLPQSDEI